MKHIYYLVLQSISFGMLCSAVTVPQFDLTIRAGSSGKFVVKAVLEKIFSIFGDDKDLLRRMACVTADMPFDMAVSAGGLWKVPAATFERTKHTDHYPNLTTYHQLIDSNFDIEWADQEWNDLDVPLKSGLAARLALTFGEADHQNIPDNLIDQANYLTRYFDSSTTAQEKLYNMHDCIRPYQCIGRAAVCITMDGSQNTGEDDRQRYRNFAQNLFDAIGNEVQSDVAAFSAGVHSIALLDDSDAISQSSHVQDGEHAVTVVNKCVSALKQYKPQKTGVPQVILLLTDKAADAGNVRKDIVHSAGFGPEEITVFVVAVGFPYKSDDLLYITEHRENRIFYVDNYNHLAERISQISESVCSVPQNLHVGQSVEDVVQKDQSRVYRLSVLFGSLVEFRIETMKGKVKAYFTYDSETPSAAVFDGAGEQRIVIPPNPKLQLLSRRKRMTPSDHYTFPQSYVYISVYGVDEENAYRFKDHLHMTMVPYNSVAVTASLPTTVFPIFLPFIVASLA